MLLAGGSYVYTVQENRAKLQKVKTGVEGRERVEIVEGLREGEMVVVVGQQDLQDGQTVVPLGAGDGEKRPREDVDRPPRRPDRDSADAAITRRGAALNEPGTLCGKPSRYYFHVFIALTLLGLFRTAALRLTFIPIYPFRR